MPNRIRLTAVAAMVGCLVGSAHAQTPPVRIAAVTLANEDGQTGGRRCRPIFVPRENEGAFVVVVLENTTAQTQRFSLGMKIDGQGPGGGSSGTIDAMRRSLLPSGHARFDAGLHTVIATVCATSFPCGDGVDDDVLDEVTFQFRVRE